MPSYTILLDKHYLLFASRGLQCDGCNHGKDYYSEGYRCIQTRLYFHNECARSGLEIRNLYHPQHSLHLKVLAANEDVNGECKLCRGYKDPRAFFIPCFKDDYVYLSFMWTA
ncbi:hypothetical protein ARALYDRAFT_915501 [Arabidopsis lyrata subsp. lyrata]|uniref:DC1 domain-containing protein n=1 Tax=Arabidopsis lyrata subsp. lyrata TaxID=81972 RepID=D7MH85_ARALL|nr:hypothetical protein ARALYDRAFT_915501 [Arabidopsis lyrata subsp. lyrata]